MKYVLPLALMLTSLPSQAGLLEWLGLRDRNPEHVTTQVMDKMSQESWKLNPGNADTCPGFVNVRKDGPVFEGHKSVYHFSTTSEPDSPITSFEKSFVVDHDHKNKSQKECETVEVLGKACETSAVKIKKGIVSFKADSRVKMSKEARKVGLKQIDGASHFIYNSNEHSLQFRAAMRFQSKFDKKKIDEKAEVTCSYSQLPKADEVAEEKPEVVTSDRAIAADKPEQDEVLEEVPEDGEVVSQ